ncbi:MAG TPA: diacylglycerol kinase family protein [Pyrinomonadaceae bacterium]|nr:sphingosine kinase [Acidobacteriota bacterium]HQZ97530.1 diacylglycerol kinase family protein [Pyrinomonadaceae bacterium]
MPPIEVIINAAGGSFVEGETEQKLKDAFAVNGLDAKINLARTGEQIGEFAEAAAKSDAEIIVAGGGDGTISSVAAIVSKANKTFGVLPLGTLNNFSKDLQIPQDITEAVRMIADGNVAEIDLAELNGRIFINNSSIGLYPHIVKDREKQQERLGYGKWRAAFWAALKIFRLSPFLKVGIVVDGKFFLRKTPFVFIGNNQYEMDLYNIGRRPALDQGKLSIYFLHRGGRFGVIRLLFRTVTGRVKQWKDFEEVLAEDVSIQTRRKRIHVAFDGEVSVAKTPLRYTILPKAVRVFVPKPATEESEDA